ncbi:plexin-C1 isoform X2 [Melanotaenia boesemani]|uniref:plexin-C1 isoform X2 n=1 Tax=Melanotaenia boesemani TaxID=1250792 RepID=UPI001C050351|nr:plexin-C1 isoform X2 [Melanotaenia boesemani]
MILLLSLFCSLWVEPVLSLEEDEGFTFDGDLQKFALSKNNVYVATEKNLYQLSHDLSRVSESAPWTATFRVTLLLPFVENKTLVSCGVTDKECGYCEILDLKNISNLLHSENILVGPKRRSNASVGFLVDVKKDSTQTDTYILTAIQQHGDESSIQCSSDSKTINLYSVYNTQSGGLFSVTDDRSTTVIRSEGDVEFVDGFQINSTVYLLSNVRPSDEKIMSQAKVRLIWLESEKSKTQTLKSLQGATLSISEGGGSCRLMASSIIPGGQQVLWSGVFSVDGEESNTELVVFDISPDRSSAQQSGASYIDPNFYINKPGTPSKPKILKPNAVLFKQNHMTSVLAVRQRSWMVFFIGTGDGQLIKLVVDRNYRPACPRVLYRANNDRQVFPNILLDPVDYKYVYVPFRNQIRREPVANCGSYRDVQECWSAQDPYCVWCGSKKSCTFESDCKDSDWLSIPDELHQKIVSHKVEMDPTGQIKLVVQTHLTGSPDALSNFACQFSSPSRTLDQISSPPKFPQCTNILSNEPLPADGLAVTVKIRLETTTLTEKLNVINCSDIRGPPSPVMCQKCIKAGCGWSNNACSWANQGVQNDSFCQKMEAGMNFSRPEISSIEPSAVSFYGRNHALLSGHNLHSVTGVRIQADMDCSPRESPVWNNTGVTLTFHIPSTDTKGLVKVCLLLPDGSCHSNAMIIYKSSPVCTSVTPSSSWRSGKRKMTLSGAHLEFVEGVIHSHNPQKVVIPINSSYQYLVYETPAAVSTVSHSTVSVKVANQTLACSSITYYPDPVFTSFTSVSTGDHVRVTIQKEPDNLEITAAELSVWGVHEETHRPCYSIVKASNNTFTCEIKQEGNTKFQQLQINVGDETITLKSSSLLLLLVLLTLVAIPVIIIVVVIVYRSKQKKLHAKMNRFMEDLELNIRNDIRQGFVDLQTDRAELMENVGTIPFLDYKHFASKIFFPESESLMALCIKDIGQDGVKVQLDECCQDLSQLIQDQLFLTSMVHALEEQKSFTIKDKCALASLLTVALHGNLPYLTEVMKVLLMDLMEQNSNAQPKLLLRRTESIVEKLLTNWMSICLYGFLRETAGQHLFLMVSALTQHIAKGPVDSVTEKALYTLSEDWLLWQAQDFSSLKLKVLFAVGSDGEVSEPLEVDALSCDTVEQLKEKILSAFKAKFGFPYNIPFRDVCVEYEKDGSFIALQEVDASSEVIGEVTMLNTLKRYKVTDGATIKVLSKKNHPPLCTQGSLKGLLFSCR